MANRRRWRIRSGSIALVVAFASACSTTDEANEPPSTTVASTTSTAPEPTTTTTVTSTTVTTTPAWTDDQLAVIAAYEAHTKDLVASLLDPASDLEVLRRHATAEYADALIATISEARPEGLTARGTYRDRPLTVVAESGTTMVLRICAWGRIEQLDPSGEVTVEADSAPTIGEHVLVQVTGIWLVDGVAASPAGDAGEACEL